MFSRPSEIKRLDIQGLRAVAALSVVLFHASSWLPGGFLGVDIFFVISGFIVAHIVAADWSSSGQFDWRGFTARRLRRVLPPMATVVIATLALGMFIDTPSRSIITLPMTGIAALAGLANVYFYQGATDYFQTFQSNPLLHLWSLSVEIQFYLLCAVTLAAGLRVLGHANMRAQSAVFAVVAVLTLISAISALTIETWHTALGIDLFKPFSFFLLPMRLWEFGLGILAKLLSEPFARRLARRAAVNVIQVAGMAMLLSGLRRGSDAHLVPGAQALLPCFGAALILMTGPGGIAGRILSHPVLTYFGDRSYSIYLWQGPLIGYAAILFVTPEAIALSAVFAVLIAVLTSHRVENAFRFAPGSRDGQPVPALNPALAAYACVFAVCFAAGLLFPSTIGKLGARAAVRATWLDEACERQRERPGLAPCIYGTSDQHKVLLVGDSHAGALSQAVVEGALHAGWQPHIAAATGCSVPDYPENNTERSYCAGYAANIIDYVRATRIRFVVVHQFSDLYTGKIGVPLDRWRSGLAEFASEITRAGAALVIAGDTPRAPIAAGRPLGVSEWHADFTASIKVLDRIEQAERAAIAGIEGASYLRSRDFFCRGATCPIFSGGHWQYTDADHLSWYGAAPLAKPIEDLLRKTAAQAATATR